MRFAALLLVVGFAGCASWPEKKCVGDTCYIRADAEQVDRHCTKGKKMWDDGSAYDASNLNKRARCCIRLRPNFWNKDKKRFAVWVARGEEECLPHEECHKAIFKSDNYIFFPENHKKCHDFGFGKPKGMPK